MADEEPEDETIKKYILSVEYVFGDTCHRKGTAVAPTWSAEISSLLPYEALITSPSIPGYEPDQAEVTFNYAAGELKSDQHITVKYNPANMGYTVIHCRQNVDDDNYVEYAVETRYGLTESPVPSDLGGTKDAPRYQGFEALPYVIDNIAADGSTTVKIYYDRVYYLMTFELNGGHGTKPIYARYGTKIEGVDNPRKSGYSFDGWAETVGGEAVVLPATMPARNSTYHAKWATVDASYTVAYWIVNSAGERIPIGSRIEWGVSEGLASGQDDLATAVICGNETVHVHSDACYECDEAAHKHTKEVCFASMNLQDVTAWIGNGAPAIRDLEDGGNPETGYIYVLYSASSGQYWPKLYLEDSNGNGKYYVVDGVEGGDTEASYSSIVEGAAIKSKTGTYNGENLTTYKYRPRTNCGIVQHIHDDSYRTCTEHIHNPNCYYTMKHLEYVPSDASGEGVTLKTDKDIVIRGTGTSVVNVYYRYKQFTLKFYYAATTGGTDTDSDGIKDTGFETIKIVGGTTYYFGSLCPHDTPEDKPLLEYMYWDYSGQWGEITALPTMNERGVARNYTKGAEVHTKNGTEVTYHYISFKARYLDNIAEYWPCDVFNPATRKSITGNTNGWKGTQAFVSAWNGEDHVKYSRDESNETIKGNYELLDDHLLFYTGYQGEYDEVSYMCFWENGAPNIPWNIPRLFRYNIYLQTYPGQDLSKETVLEGDNGKQYYRVDTYDTCDNSNVDEQTQVGLTGYVATTLSTAHDKYSLSDKKWEYRDLTGTEDANLLQEAGYFDSRLYATGKEVNFYYDRASYTLFFENYGNPLSDGRGTEIPYLDPLRSRFLGITIGDQTYEGANQIVVKPEKYPSTLEPGAYEFEGWYLSDQFLPNEKVDPETIRMPAENLKVYANWVPKSYDVTLTVDMGTETWTTTFTTTHGSTVKDAVGAENLPQEPTESALGSFIGWFYIDKNGTEEFFDFSNTPVTEDTLVYAKWKSSKLKTVTVRYVTIDKDGNEVEIADTETYSAYVGNLRTYEAKIGEDLYEGYRKNYYPNTDSSSITVSEDDALNEVKFIYVQKASVPYRVEYLIRDENGNTRPALRKKSGEPGYEFVGDMTIPDDEAYVLEVTDHGKSVVTEFAIRIPSYVSDQYQKRLILSSDEDKNVIRFYYTYDPTLAYYTVNHYVLKPGVTMPTAPADYELYPNSNSHLIGIVGNVYEASPATLPGMTFSESVTKELMVDDTWDADGKKLSTVLKEGDVSELNFFYTRNFYDYQVQYVDADNGSMLLPTKTTDSDGNQLSAQFGVTVTEYAAAIEGFQVDASVKNHSIKIGNVGQNTITFYYHRTTGDLKISKAVELDPTQKAENPSLTLPDGAETRPFNFVVVSEKPFYKSEFAYTLTRKNGTEESGTVAVKAGSYYKVLEAIPLCDGESVVIHDLALGSYTVREEHVAGYKTTINSVEREHFDFQLDIDGQEVTADVTNTYPFFTGDLVLSKTIKKLAATDPVGTGEIFTFTVTVRPEEGTLEETRTIKFKTLDADGNSIDGTYVIPEDGYGGTYQFSLLMKAGDTVTVQNVPAGSFTVVETIDADHYATDYYRVTYDKVISGNTNAKGTSNTVNGMILGGHATEVGYTNTYKKGNLTIQKTVTQEVSYDSWQNDTFTFRVTGVTQLPDGTYDILIDGQAAVATVTDGNVTLSGNPTVAVSRTEGTDSWSNSVIVENLPAGIYAVEEIAAAKGLSTYDITYEAASNLKLPIEGVETTAKITNTFKRSTGSMVISKTIQLVGNGVEEIDLNAEFDFTVVMPTDGSFNGKNYFGTLTDRNNVKHLQTFAVADGKFTFQLKHGESLEIRNLPVGTYTVQEAPESGYASSFPHVDSDGNAWIELKVETATETSQPCVNRYPVYVGDLRLQKTVVRESDQDTMPDDTFTFTVQSPTYAGKTFTAEGVLTTVTADASGKITVALKHGEEILIKNLPEGECTVTEMLPTGRESEYEASYVINSGESTDGAQAVFAIVTGHESTVAFTNEYKRQQADLIIRKNNAAEENQVFVYEVKNTETNDVITVTVTGNSSTRICNLPFGEYTVTQKNDWSWRYTDSSQTITLDATDREDGETVRFTGGVKNPKWLDGNSPLIKNRKKKEGG